jgi:hypothetical protein
VGNLAAADRDIDSDEEVPAVATTPDNVAPTPENVAPTPEDRSARTDRSPWNWLLVLPIVLPLMTPLFNSDEPRLFGFPTFYWLQFAFILVGVTTTSIVYQMTKTKRGR